eukprot:Em0020g135a
MDTGIRQGSTSLFRWMQHENVAPASSGLLLALASSCGDVIFLKLKESSEGDLIASKVERIHVTTDRTEALCLSLDWSKDLSNPLVVVSSDSSGCLHLVDVATGTTTSSWKAHDFEAWISALDHDSSVVFSGGDDCRLHMWDARNTKKPLLTSKRHEMGVCSIQVHPTLKHIVASGSYDEVFCLWDKRQMSKPIKDLRLGGGVWRVKWHKSHADWVATACMHNGFTITDSRLNAGAPAEVLCSYKGHSSLAYGVDWCWLEHEAWRGHDHYAALLATCSFYDHCLHIWTANLPA